MTCTLPDTLKRALLPDLAEATVRGTDPTELVLPSYLTNTAADSTNSDPSDLAYFLDLGLSVSASAPAPGKPHICVPPPHMRRPRVYRRAPKRPPSPRDRVEGRKRRDTQSRSGVDG